MGNSKRSTAKSDKIAAPNSKERTEKTEGYITLPATKAGKTDPEAVWEKPSYNPDVGDEDEEEARIVTDAIINP